jgi:hypothetical protein
VLFDAAGASQDDHRTGYDASGFIPDDAGDGRLGEYGRRKSEIEESRQELAHNGRY